MRFQILSGIHQKPRFGAATTELVGVVIVSSETGWLCFAQRAQDGARRDSLTLNDRNHT
jgi:hypothetical protein